MGPQEETKNGRSMMILPNLFALIERSDRIVVKDLSRVPDGQVLYESTDKADVVALQDTMHACLAEPLILNHGVCPGNPVIFLYEDGNNELLQISTHRGSKRLKCSIHVTDLPLMNREKWLQWFDDRNIRGPRQEASLLEMRQKNQAQGYRKWMAAMPRYLRGIWKKHETTLTFDGRCPDALRQALHKRLSGKTVEEKVVDLLTWYGSSGNQSQGAPIYERVAEALLLDYSSNTITDAISTHETSSQVDTRLMNGAAKLFAGARFQKKYPTRSGLEQQNMSLKQLAFSFKS